MTAIARKVADLQFMEFAQASVEFAGPVASELEPADNVCVCEGLLSDCATRACEA